MVIAHTSGSVEWSRISQPSEWPDEDWPRRVMKAYVFHKKFAKLIRKALVAVEAEAQVYKIESKLASKRDQLRRLNEELKTIKDLKKQGNLEKHYQHQERLAKINYLKSKYIFQVLQTKCGTAFAQEVFDEAQALAHSNVDSATWTD